MRVYLAWFLAAVVGAMACRAALDLATPAPLCAQWPGRQAVYSTAGLPVVWDRSALPLPYAVRLKADQADLVEAVRDAATLWNREVGFPVLRESSLEEALVLVVSGDANAGGVAATSHTGDVVPASAAVELRAVGNVGEAYGAMVHEFGHVLGLADGVDGCMGPLPEGFDPSTTFWLPRGEEIDYLRAVYRR